jgi:hypothetical protein
VGPAPGRGRAGVVVPAVHRSLAQRQAPEDATTVEEVVIIFRTAWRAPTSA